MIQETAENLRYVVAQGAEPPACDELGFTVTDAAGLVPISEILSRAATIVVAPPWTGKSFIARALERRARSGLDGAPGGFAHVHLTRLGIAAEAAAVTPAWLGSVGTGHQPSLWICDAIDEGEHRSPGTIESIIDALAELGPRLPHLRMVMLARDGDVPHELERRLAAGLASDSWPLKIFRLALLDRPSASDLLRQRGHPPEKFDEVCELIRRCDLQPVAGFPKALEVMAEVPRDADLTPVGVWRGVLEKLIEEPQPGRRAEVSTAIGTRFQIGARMAAALTLAGRTSFSARTFGERIPAIRDLVDPQRDTEGWAAAQDLFKSAVLAKDADDSWRFQAKHIQEWLGAFGLSHLPLTALRPAVCGSSGAPLPVHRSTLALLALTTEHGDVRDWIEGAMGVARSDASPWTLADSVRILDQLEAVLRRARHPVYWDRPEELQKLGAPGLDELLRERLADRRRATGAKMLMLRIAAATKLKTVTPVAVGIALDPKAAIPLRHAAVRFVSRFGKDHEVGSLRPIAMRGALRAERQALAAAVLDALVDRDLMSVADAAALAPIPQKGLIDSRAMLWSTLEKRLTPGDARIIVQRGALARADLDAADDEDDPRELESLLRRAIELLLGQAPIAADDVVLLRPFTMLAWDAGRAFELGHRIVAKVREDQSLRRILYQSSLAEVSAIGSSEDGAWRHCLLDADLSWLMELLESGPPSRHVVVQDLRMLALRASDSTGGGVVHRARTMAQREDPGAYERATRQLEEHEQQLALVRDREKRAEPERFTLTALVEEMLVKTMPSEHRLWELSHLCFVDEPFRYTNVDGQFAQLPQELRNRILRAVRDLLATVAPTPIPTASGYPVAVAYEAAAFAAVFEGGVTVSGAGELIRRWLRTAFVGLSNETTELLRLVHRQDADATESVLIEALDQAIRSGDAPSLASMMPVELWSDAVVSRVSALVEDESVPPASRTGLLRLLSRRQPGQALASARRWASDGETSEFQDVGLDILLVIEPDRGWPILEARFSQRGKGLLLSLPWLHSWDEDVATPVLSWSAERRSGLADMLMVACPPQEDPHRAGAYMVGPDDKLRRLRDVLIGSLADAEVLGNAEALAWLVQRHPRLRRWRNRTAAEQRLSRVVHQLGSGPIVPPEFLGLAEVVRLLDEGDFRVVRNVGDLLRLVLELCRKVGEYVGQDLELLYVFENRRMRKVRHEEALSSYLRSQLRHLVAKALIHAEVKQRARGRTDLLVTATSVTGDPLELVIEVKWSSNPDVLNGVSLQLGARYLKGAGKTHGIYFVAWNGTCRPAKTGRPGRIRSLRALSEALASKADRYCRRHPQLVIATEVLDTSWPAGTRRRRASRRDTTRRRRGS